jgi:signal transduction histidine kinase
MGDSRYRAFFERVRDANDRAREIRLLPDEGVVAALAASAEGNDPYLTNVLATEALNRLRRRPQRTRAEAPATSGAARGRPPTVTHAASKVAAGEHVCLVYETQEEQLAAAAAYISKGLDSGDRCVYIADENSAATIADALRAHGVDPEESIESGALSILTKRDTYLEDGTFDPDRMIRMLEALAREAQEQGYAGLRVSGEMTWALGAGIAPEKLLEYESKLNRLFPGSNASAVCQYNKRKFSPEVMLGVIETHPLIAYDGFVCDNFYYVPPQEISGPDGSAVKVERLLENVRGRAEAELEIRRLNRDLERLVADRTRELQDALRDLESFSYTVSHDLRAPLRGMDFYAQALQEDHGDRLDGEGREFLARLRRESQRLGTLVTHLLAFSSLSRAELRPEPLDLSEIAGDVVRTLRAADPEREIDVVIDPHLHATGDPQLVRVALENLLGNAWKFTRKAESPRITLTACRDADCTVFEVRDNGAGFDPARADRLFSAFSRLHTASEFEGTGVGLATVARIVRRHGGKIWAEGRPGAGAVFRFTLASAGSNVAVATEGDTRRVETRAA